MNNISNNVLLIFFAPFFSLAVLGGSASAADQQKHDPCQLLTSTEVEAVMGPLAGLPYRAAGATPHAKGHDCRYEGVAGRSMRIEVTWDHGAQLIGMMGAMEAVVKNAGLSELKLSDSSTVTGEWDRAHINQCCEFAALQNDQLVTIDVAGSHATIRQAASLAAAAIKRLDKPLDVDGNAGIQAAQERAASRPKPRDVCALVSQADAEAIAGTTLSAPPHGDTGACTYEWPLDANGMRYTLKLLVQWKDGFHDMRQVSSILGNASSMLGFNEISGQAAVKGNDGPWDEYSKSIVGVMAVKSDVMASVESGPFRQDIARAFVEKAIVNMSK